MKISLTVEDSKLAYCVVVCCRNLLIGCVSVMLIVASWGADEALDFRAQMHHLDLDGT
jgi:hypothetical protein